MTFTIIKKSSYMVTGSIEIKDYWKCLIFTLAFNNVLTHKLINLTTNMFSYLLIGEMLLTNSMIHSFKHTLYYWSTSSLIWKCLQGDRVCRYSNDALSSLKFFRVMIHLLWQLLQFFIIPTTISGLVSCTELSLMEQFLQLLIRLILCLQLFNPLWKATWKAWKFCTNFFNDSSPLINVVNSWKFKDGYPSNNSKNITQG